MRRQRVYLPPGMDPDDLPDPRDLAEDAADFAAEQKAARQRRALEQVPQQRSDRE
ncbi:hypothetical protein [Kineosporia succinea]|uniref:YfhD-like protein n=1 Tax=Kineosporia succinea TaxID=84632 RepID=A0ABT9P9J2_9ACTN|nr:hypothetical protein [Kineosporia succinea]MDP9829353.1 hypothetical protein [Kineosporia succinea]